MIYLQKCGFIFNSANWGKFSNKWLTYFLIMKVIVEITSKIVNPVDIYTFPFCYFN